MEEEEVKKRIEELESEADGIYGFSDLRDKKLEKAEFLKKFYDAMWGW